MDRIKKLILAIPDDNHLSTQPTPPNTPFLGLRAKLSLSFVSPTVIYLLFSAWHLYRVRETVQSIVFSTKEVLIQNCQDLERSISILASFPDIAAEAAHHALIVGIESAIEQINQGLQIMLQGILETVEFIATFLTGTWRCFLVHLADSGIPLISDIGDGGVQAIDQLTATLIGLLTLPFNELGVLIQQEMNAQGFRESIARISVQPMDKIEFCAGTVGSLSVDALTADFRRWILYGTLGITTVAALTTFVNMGLISYQHRRWKAHIQRIMLQLPKIESTPAVQHASHARNNRTKDLERSDTTTTTTTATTAVQIDQLAHHPLLFRFVDASSRRLFPTNETNRTLFLWFTTYITHPPALTCLLLGSLGLILVYTQIILLNYTRTHYCPIFLLQPLTTLSHTVLLDVRRAMARPSAQFARDTNTELARLESSINARVFSAIVHAAGEMASALDNVQTSLVEGVQEVFGGLFGTLVLAVLGCLLLKKLDKVRAGLVWVQNHAQMSLPRLAPEVLVVSQARVEKMVRKAMEGQGSGGEQQQQGQVQEQVAKVVARILAQYEAQLRGELPVYYGLVVVWVAVVGLGAAGVFFRRRELNKKIKS
ncbi:plasma membrane fusion protein prm1 [Podila horticola]|nr:plasma membrane fusion protein prm1 [Podila horticola]